MPATMSCFVWIAISSVCNLLGQIQPWICDFVPTPPICWVTAFDPPPLVLSLSITLEGGLHPSDACSLNSLR
jgi:hypothetical protein